MDNRLIRFTNCLSLLSCVCDVAAIFDENLRHLAQLIHVTAELVFYTVIGCVAQTFYRCLFFVCAGVLMSLSLPPADDAPCPRHAYSSLQVHRIADCA
jgi:hypothetical protein